MKTKIMMIALLLGVLVIIGCATISFEEKMATAEIPYIKDPMQFVTNRIPLPDIAAQLNKNRDKKDFYSKFYLQGLLMISEYEVALFYGTVKPRKLGSPDYYANISLENRTTKIVIYVWNYQDNSMNEITDAAQQEQILTMAKENYDNFRYIPPTSEEMTGEATGMVFSAILGLQPNTSYSREFKFNVKSPDGQITIPINRIHYRGEKSEADVSRVTIKYEFNGGNKQIAQRREAHINAESKPFHRTVFLENMSLSPDGNFLFLDDSIFDLENEKAEDMSLNFIDVVTIQRHHAAIMDIDPEWKKIAILYRLVISRGWLFGIPKYQHYIAVADLQMP